MLIVSSALVHAHKGDRVTKRNDTNEMTRKDLIKTYKDVKKCET